MSRQADTYVATSANKHHRSTPPGCKCVARQVSWLTTGRRVVRLPISLAFPRHAQWLERPLRGAPKGQSFTVAGAATAFRVPS